MFMKNVSELCQYNVNIVHYMRLKNGTQLVDRYQRYAEASISRCSRLELHSALVIHRV